MIHVPRLPSFSYRCCRSSIRFVLSFRVNFIVIFLSILQHMFIPISCSSCILFLTVAKSERFNHLIVTSDLRTVETVQHIRPFG